MKPVFLVVEAAPDTEILHFDTDSPVERDFGVFDIEKAAAIDSDALTAQIALQHERHEHACVTRQKKYKIRRKKVKNLLESEIDNRKENK
jgi:hypothetical protein